jgi:hypothetical protein
MNKEIRLNFDFQTHYFSKLKQNSFQNILIDVKTFHDLISITIEYSNKNFGSRVSNDHIIAYHSYYQNLQITHKSSQ